MARVMFEIVGKNKNIRTITEVIMFLLTQVPFRQRPIKSQTKIANTIATTKNMQANIILTKIGSIDTLESLNKQSTERRIVDPCAMIEDAFKNFVIYVPHDKLKLDVNVNI